MNGSAGGRNATGRRSVSGRSRRGERTTGRTSNPVLSPVLSGVVSQGDGLDEEVLSWAALVRGNGGAISDSTLIAVDGWIKTIKSSDGLRKKLKRVNLFAGDSLSAALVPIISDQGHAIDAATGFVESDYVASGNDAGLKDRNITSGNYKHLDTGLVPGDAGLTNLNGHIAVNTMGSQERSSFVPFLGHGSAGIFSGAESKKYSFHWGNTGVTAAHPSSQSYNPVMGFYLGNVRVDRASLWLNGVETGHTESISSDAFLPPESLAIFRIQVTELDSAGNVIDTSTFIERALRKSVNFYSVGDALTDDEVTVITDALFKLNQKLKRQYFEADTEEAWQWGNVTTVEKIGNPYTRMNQHVIDNVDRFMSSVSSFKDKLQRVNLFLAPSSDFYGHHSAFVPVIAKKGHRYDLSYNFNSSDFSFKGLKGNGSSKYLDTGISMDASLFDSGKDLHLAVKVETPHSSYDNEKPHLLGFSKAAGGSDGFLELTKVGENFNFNAQLDGVSASYGVDDLNLLKGFFIGSVSDSSGVKLYKDGVQKSSQGYFENYSSKGSSKLTVFGGLTESTNLVGSLTDATISCYSVGKGLTLSEAIALNRAISLVGDFRKELSATNTEVWEWANIRVPRNGGVLTQEEVDAVDTWMTSIKGAGLYSKISRLNLFVGESLAAKLVPIINTKGNVVDVNNNFSEKDTSSWGLSGGLGRYLDTGVKLSDFLTEDSGHLSIRNYANLDSIGDKTFSHGVIGSSTKPSFVLSFDADSADSYIWGNDVSASYSVTVAGTEALVYEDKTVRSLGSSSINTDNFVAHDAYKYTATSHGKHRLHWESHIKTGNWYQVWRILKNGTEILRGNFNHNASPPQSIANDGTSCQSIEGWGAAWPHAHCPRDFEVLLDNVSAGDTLEVQWAGNGAGSGQGTYIPSNWSTYNSYSGGGHYIQVREFIVHSISSANQVIDAEGLWTMTKSSSDVKLFLDKVEKASTDTTPLSLGESNDPVYLFGAYGNNAENMHDESARVGYYSVGESLSSLEITILSTSLDALEKELNRHLDEEVYDWALRRVKENDGTVSEETIDIVNTWMINAKAEGIRPLIQRLNFFTGDVLTDTDEGKAKALNAAMVPLISDEGHQIDVNNGFTSNDLLQGLYSDGGGDKFLRTGMNPLKVVGSFSSSKNFTYLASILGPRRSSHSPILMGDGVNRLEIGKDNFKENVRLKVSDTIMGSGPCVAGVNSVYDGSEYDPTSSKATGLLHHWLTESNQSQLRYGITMAVGMDENRDGHAIEVNNNQNSISDLRVRSNSTAIDAECSEGSTLSDIIVFGSSTGGDVYGNFSGRLSCYLISEFLDDDKITSISQHIKNLNISLRRGMFLAQDPEVWDWAHNTVLGDEGYSSETSYRALSQPTVDATDKFMASIKSVNGMRENIKRMNLFCGKNLNTALVPLISDVGERVETITNFVDADYVQSGKSSGLKSLGGGRVLNTKANSIDLFGDNDYHMSIKIVGGHNDNTNQTGPFWLGGAVDDTKSRLVGITNKQTAFFAGNDGYLPVTVSDAVLNCEYKAEDYYSCNIPSLITSILPPPDMSLQQYLDSIYNCHGYNYTNPDSEAIVTQEDLDKLYAKWKIRADRGSGVFKNFIDSSFWLNQGYNIFYNKNYKDQYCSHSFSQVAQYVTNQDSVVLNLGSSDIMNGDGLYSLQTENNGTTVKLYHEGALKKKFDLGYNTGSPDADFILFGFQRGATVTKFPYPSTISFYCLGEDLVDPTLLQEALDTFEADLGRAYKEKIYYGPSGKAFPTSWGKPPEIQLTDVVLLPDGYGNGSSTLRAWIIENSESSSSENVLFGSNVVTWDEEVALWANEKVPNNGGILTDEIVQAVNTWMLDIKSKAGLRSRITRCNLFVGKNLEAALVPIISDAGGPVELSYGFTNSDFIENRGLKSGPKETGSWNSDAADKWLDTALFAGNSSKLTASSGHMIMNTPDAVGPWPYTSNGLNLVMSIVPESNKIDEEGGMYLFLYSDVANYLGGAIGNTFSSKLLEQVTTDTRMDGGLICLNKNPINKILKLLVDDTTSIADEGQTVKSIAIRLDDSSLVQESSLKIFGWSYANSAAVKKGFLGTLSNYSVGDTLLLSEVDALNKAFKKLRTSLGHMYNDGTGNNYRRAWTGEGAIGF